MLIVNPAAGNAKTHKQLQHNRTGARQVLRHFMFWQGQRMKDAAESAVEKGPHRGRVYRNVRLPNKKIKRRHKASAPFQSHADLSKRLKKSIGWKTTGTHKMAFGYGVAPDKKNPMPKHGPYLEEGTTKMDPRPTLQIAIRKAHSAANADFDRALRKEKFV